MTELSSQLSQSAGKYAKRALDAYLADNPEDFVVFAGFAIEHALKAKLARENILFLAQHRRDQDFSMAVALHRSKGRVDALPPRLFTIGAADAIKIYCLLDPDNRDIVLDAQEVLDYRNDQAHLARVDEAAKKQLLIKFLRAIEVLLLIEPSEFWAPNYGVVKAWLGESLDETAQAVKERIAGAGAGFRKWIEPMDSDIERVTIEQIENLIWGEVDGEYVQSIACPACGLAARVDGYTEQSDWDVDYDDGVATSAYPILSFYPESFNCRACHLKLSAGDEFQAAELETSWPNEDVDVISWMRDHWAEDEPW